MKQLTVAALSMMLLSATALAKSDIPTIPRPPGVPIGVTGVCNDGSTTTARRGACSHHGGVKAWYAGTSTGVDSTTRRQVVTTETVAVDSGPSVEAQPVAETQTEAVSVESTTTPNTGGEPWLMGCAGLCVALGSLSLRRRI